MIRRLAAIYDVHGNLPALEAVISDVRQSKVDAIVVGGDVLPGPMPAECLDLLFALEMPVHCISGNGERAVIEMLDGAEYAALPNTVRESIRWTGAQLNDEHLKRIRAWPPMLELSVDGVGDVLFCHATPRNDMDIFTKQTSERELLSSFENVSADIVVCGHTHMQFDRVIGHVRVVNAGSVGMPFGEPGAYWMLMGPDAAMQRTSYDVVRAAERIGETAFFTGRMDRS